MTPPPKKYAYEVTLVGVWHRQYSHRHSVRSIERRLAWRGFRSPKLGFNVNSRNLAGRDYDYADEGPFRITFDVEAPNAAAALRIGENRLRKELRDMHICGNPQLRFL